MASGGSMESFHIVRQYMLEVIFICLKLLGEMVLCGNDFDNFHAGLKGIVENRLFPMLEYFLFQFRF